MRRSWVWSAVLVSIGVAACSSGSSGPSAPSGPDSGGPTGGSEGNTISGTVAGSTPQIRGAIAFVRPVAAGSAKGLDLVLSSNAATCSIFPGRSFSEFEIQVPGSPVAVGTYTVINSSSGVVPIQGQASVVFGTTVDCTGGKNDAGTGGTVTITASDANHTAGSFDITFADGHVTGTFDAPVCSPEAGPVKFECG